MPFMDARGLAMPSWERVVGTLMKGMFCCDAVSFVASIFVPPPTAMRSWGLVFLILFWRVWSSWLLIVLMVMVFTFLFVCWRRLATFFPAICRLLGPAMMRAVPVRLSLWVTSVMRVRVPSPTMTSLGSCM